MMMNSLRYTLDDPYYMIMIAFTITPGEML